jgi:hypothetical protein
MHYRDYRTPFPPHRRTECLRAQWSTAVAGAAWETAIAPHVNVLGDGGAQGGGGACTSAMGRLWRRGKGLAVVVLGALALATIGRTLRHRLPGRTGVPELELELAADATGPFVAHAEGLYAMSARSIDGGVTPLSKYVGRVTVVANVASF